MLYHRGINSVPLDFYRHDNDCAHAAAVQIYMRMYLHKVAAIIFRQQSLETHQQFDSQYDRALPI